MHWVLDVNMGEDACQINKDNGAANVACLRHMASNMVRAEPTKISLVLKQKRCLMNTSFLEKVLAAGIPAMVEKKTLMCSPWVCLLVAELIAGSNSIGISALGE
ncbi:hypothetical protein BZG20_15385 [Salinivibrio sp. IB868]|nr:hypothetical protein BZG20_15385 [Salinivibrio sp. IB868]OOE74404.1 hypothetical protein BZG22_07850 [Salinivibrio sp. IB870]